jgi:hypothetical protein
VTSNGASAAAVDTGGGQRRATLRTAAIASAAVGVGAVAVGAIFGLRARSKNSEALSLCADGSCATQAELDHHDALVGEARDARTTSIIAFAGGGAALAAGAIVYVLSSSDHPATSARLAPSFGPRGVALTFGGAFDAF